MLKQGRSQWEGEARGKLPPGHYKSGRGEKNWLAGKEGEKMSEKMKRKEGERREKGRKTVKEEKGKKRRKKSKEKGKRKGNREREGNKHCFNRNINNDNDMNFALKCSPNCTNSV